MSAEVEPRRNLWSARCHAPEGEKHPEWKGPVREMWFDSKLDAVAHNLKFHPQRTKTWAEIIEGTTPPPVIPLLPDPAVRG